MMTSVAKSSGKKNLIRALNPITKLLGMVAFFEVSILYFRNQGVMVSVVLIILFLSLGLPLKALKNYAAIIIPLSLSILIVHGASIFSRMKKNSFQMEEFWGAYTNRCLR